MTQQNTIGVVRQLDARLAHLQASLLSQVLHGNSYSDIWDLCCDHGRLGLHLHKQPLLAQTHVHLIDCVPSIINKLQAMHAANIDHRLTVMCMDAATITLPACGNHALIIAGVGGDTCINILRSLLPQISDYSKCTAAPLFTDVYLSPNSSCYELRQFLAQHNAQLISEDFIGAKGRYHEHIVVRFYRQEKPHSLSAMICCTGISLWHPFTAAKNAYLQKILTHHQHVNAYCPVAWRTQAIEDYTKLLNNLWANG
jgi:tRNA (adenine22-N1)-methyltransferase